MKYRRCPVEVEAVQWTGQPVSELPEWLQFRNEICEPNLLTDERIGCWFTTEKQQSALNCMTDAEFRAAYEPIENEIPIRHTEALQKARLIWKQTGRAEQWMRTENPTLDGKRPVDCDECDVLRYLGQIEYGVYT